MGCTQSKADAPKGPSRTMDRQKSAKEEYERRESKRLSALDSHIGKRKHLDIMPPPVKAIPKVSPKGTVKRGN
ncbi:Uncharacterized protein PCOAH_00017830 [Plasmodium coatneyi]|uniref:Uncharacterized protein n=1 Tax=Plasmodium coatneyi TaxID=208452 RepID=A0A1B1DXC3_9APIC|nr:Uncharacterized protein PCOAH_00017830 [Plasmodium coatneyi]ANQ07279.1 Uncharacterized protein PCOAH_00017830 [Plasmodium coatneyi]